MRGHAKFLFDTDFAVPGRRPAAAADPEPVEPSLPLHEHRAELQRVEAAALERGRLEGHADADAEASARLSQALERIGAMMGEAVQGFQEAAARTEHEAAALALAMARTLAGTLLARHPAAEIEALARSLFGHLRHTPHVVVRLNEALVDHVKPSLDRIAHEQGFAGRIVVLGEPDIAPGDARLEWADGGAVRDRAAVDAVLERSVRLYLDSAAERRGDQR